jgi:hypothetical protein
MRRVLNAHSEVNVADETHYFDDLRQRVGGTAPLSTGQKAEVVSYFSALRLREYMFGAGLKSRDRADETAAFEELQNIQTADEAFAEYCRLAAAGQGKRVWGEKTPRHLFQIEEILSAFPTSRIIIMMRDPRAVIASHRDWRQGWLNAHAEVTGLDAEVAREAQRMQRSYNLTIVALIWRAAAATALRLTEGATDPRVRLVRFEELVTRPGKTLQSVLDWLELPFEPALLHTIVSKSSYAADENRKGFNADAIERWKARLSEPEAAYVDAICGTVVARLGYPASGARLKPWFTLQELLKLPFSLLLAARANRHRIGNLKRFVLIRARSLRS